MITSLLDPSPSSPCRLLALLLLLDYSNNLIWYPQIFDLRIDQPSTT